MIVSYTILHYTILITILPTTTTALITLQQVNMSNTSSMTNDYLLSEQELMDKFREGVDDVLESSFNKNHLRHLKKKTK